MATGSIRRMNTLRHNGAKAGRNGANTRGTEPLTSATADTTRGKARAQPLSRATLRHNGAKAGRNGVHTRGAEPLTSATADTMRGKTRARPLSHATFRHNGDGVRRNGANTRGTEPLTSATADTTRGKTRAQPLSRATLRHNGAKAGRNGAEQHELAKPGGVATPRDSTVQGRKTSARPRVRCNSLRVLPAKLQSNPLPGALPTKSIDAASAAPKVDPMRSFSV